MQVKTKQEKKTHTVVDTISFTERDTKSWEVPPFQSLHWAATFQVRASSPI